MIPGSTDCVGSDQPLFRDAKDPNWSSFPRLQKLKCQIVPLTKHRRLVSRTGFCNVSQPNPLTCGVKYRGTTQNLQRAVYGIRARCTARLGNWFFSASIGANILTLASICPQHQVALVRDGGGSGGFQHQCPCAVFLTPLLATCLCNDDTKSSTISCSSNLVSLCYTNLNSHSSPPEPSQMWLRPGSLWMTKRGLPRKGRYCGALQSSAVTRPRGGKDYRYILRLLPWYCVNAGPKYRSLILSAGRSA